MCKVLFFIRPSGYDITNTIATKKEALWEQVIANPAGEKFGVNRMASLVPGKKPKPNRNKLESAPLRF